MRGRRHALPLASVNAAQPALRTLPTTARRATLRRALGLLADFRYEQPDPARFYHHLAADTAQLIAAIVRDTHGTDLSGARILDVGGGPGYFAAEFARRKAHYITVEPDAGEMSAAGITVAASVRGSGDHLPIATNSLDVAYSSNVAEHVAHPWALGDEMLRVTRPGGLVIYSYTVWLGPFGGHETDYGNTTWAATSPATATPSATATRRKTSTASPYSPCPAPRAWTGRARPRSAAPRVSWGPSPAITPGGHGGSPACPACARLLPPTWCSCWRWRSGLGSSC